MKTHPICKINLGLRVLRRRPDNYHDLATIFLPLPLCDELEILPLSPEEEAHQSVIFSQTGILVDCLPEDNICVKAYNLLKKDFPDMPAVKMHLEKVIPFGAGLGGGSSDAAFTLKMLNELFALGLDNLQLKDYAARLGADCAFFIDCQPAYATGIGNILTPLPSNPLKGCTLVLVKPNESVSTREAYAGLRLSVQEPERYEGPIEESPLIQATNQPIETWRDTIVNDFERTIFPIHPAIWELKELFYQNGATYACMSGSGAALFALYRSEEELPQELLDNLSNNHIFTAKFQLIEN